MLTQLWPGGGWPVDVAVGHHERNDGTGYPNGRKEMALPSIVRLVAVCDVYAALATPRPYRPAYSTRTALTETLSLAEREHLDKPSAERLLLLSFYPVGSRVELNDGSIGVVTGAQRGPDALLHPDRPIVQLEKDAQGNALDWPMMVDLAQHKDRSILRVAA
jgi:hypothetical protein